MTFLNFSPLFEIPATWHRRFCSYWPRLQVRPCCEKAKQVLNDKVQAKRIRQNHLRGVRIKFLFKASPQRGEVPSSI